MVITKLGGGGSAALKAIAEAVGEPAGPNDKKEQLVNIINNAQADIAELCNKRGCSIPVHPTFPQIMGGISKLTHFTKPAQVSGLRAVGNHDTANKIDLFWTNPAGDSNFRGVKILYKTGSYPTSATDGTVAYDGTGTSVEKTGLSNGTTYYFRAFAYNLSNNIYSYNTGTSGAQCSEIPFINKGLHVFTSSGTFTVPARVSRIDVFLVGGGSAGNTKGRSHIGAAGGAGGYTKTVKNITVTPGQTISAVIGAGGAGQTLTTQNGKVIGGSGGTSTITINGNAYSVAGGSNNTYGHIGGSGGGTYGTFDYAGGSGGSDGGDGGGQDNLKPGTGQHTTTRAFGEVSNTLYAGGGGGGGTCGYGSGGAGGGTNASDIMTSENCTANTGGCSLSMYQSTDYKGNKAGNGGSGIVIVRWGY